MTMPETIAVQHRIRSAPAPAASGRLWVRAQSIRQPSDCARRQPSIRACSAVSAATSTSTPVDLEIGGAVDRRDAALAALELGIENARADQEQSGNGRNHEGKRAADGLHAGLLASWPWKSKQVLVGGEDERRRKLHLRQSGRRHRRRQCAGEGDRAARQGDRAARAPTRRSAASAASSTSRRPAIATRCWSPPMTASAPSSSSRSTAAATTASASISSRCAPTI